MRIVICALIDGFEDEFKFIENVNGYDPVKSMSNQCLRLDIYVKDLRCFHYKFNSDLIQSLANSF